MVLQFFCSICNVDYSSIDEVFSTRCGHVFHSSCLRDALSRSQTCPSCQASCYLSDIFKIYINCNNSDSQANIDENFKLKTELELSIKNTSEFQLKLDESEKNFMQLHEQLDAVQKERQALLQEKQYLQVISKSLEEELNGKRAENTNLKKTLEVVKRNVALVNNEDRSLGVLTNDGAATRSDLAAELAVKNRTIETLQRQLNEKTLELEKEIRNSTTLNFEKMQLQQRVNGNTASMLPPASRPTEGKTNRFKSNAHSGSLQEMTYLFGGSSNSLDGAASNRLPATAVAKKSPRMDREAYQLFQHAKTLYKFGFKYVFAENGAVFTRTHDGCVPIKIVSRQQVDEMIRKFKAFSLEVSAPNSN